MSEAKSASAISATALPATPEIASAASSSALREHGRLPRTIGARAPSTASATSTSSTQASKRACSALEASARASSSPRRAATLLNIASTSERPSSCCCRNFRNSSAPSKRTISRRRFPAGGLYGIFKLPSVFREASCRSSTSVQVDATLLFKSGLANKHCNTSAALDRACAACAWYCAPRAASMTNAASNFDCSLRCARRSHTLCRKAAKHAPECCGCPVDVSLFLPACATGNK
mmetsp:Transcript_68443/g.196343  ORF Transcript_68443/g.196343 Transcript_68443/m.196343 type:complete len:234 (-) Transcript_68443:1057-1758(-)